MPEVTDPRLLEILNKPAGQRAAPQPVLSLPNTGKAQERANDQVRTDIAVEGNDRARANERLGNAQTLRKEFDALPEVKSYKVASQQLAQALNTGDGAQGDLALTYAFVKAMDPDSVVREAEQGMVAGSQPWLDAAAENVKKQFGMDGAGNYTPEARAAIRQQIIRAVAARNKQYVQRRADFSELANRNQIDPFEVVGKHMGSVYLDQFRAYDKQRREAGANVGMVAGANAPNMTGGLPTGSQIEFGGGQEGPFDRTRYLQDTLGISPEQENLLQGFWSANSGNANLTPDAVRAWYQQNGIPQLSEEGLANMLGQARKMPVGSVWGGVDTSQAEEAYRAKLRADLEAQGFDPTSAGAYGARAIRGAELGLTDEIEGALGAMGALVSNRGVADGYRDARDRTREAYAQMEDKQGWMGTAAELAGGVLPALVSGGASGGSMAGAARQGAMAGGAAGFGYGEGLAGSTGGAVLGAATGGALGAGGQKVADALAGRQARYIQGGGAMPSSAADAYAQGQKFGVDLSVGDVRGMGAKASERLLDVQPGGAGVMNAARQRLTGQLESAVENVADTFGPETSFRGMGEAAQAGVKNWRGRFDALTEKLYNAIPIKAETNASLGNTIGALDELTNKITSNPKLAGMLTDKRLVGYLEALKGKVSQVPTGVVDMNGNPITREVVEGGSLSWNDLKQLRSRIGEEIGDQILGEGTLKSDLRRLYGALSQDMEATAQAQGTAAFRAFKTANDTYKAGQEKLERVWTSLLGKDGERTPEAAAGFIQRITKEGKGSGDLAQIAELRRTLKPDEWGQVSNGLIRLMGQPANSAGREFSPQTFTRVYADMSAEAKNLLFGGSNKALRQNLDEFAQVVERIAKNDSTRNTSNTAMGIAGMTGFGLGGAPGVLGQAMFSYGAAKLWTSPQFVRWATGYSKMLAGAARNGGQIKGTAFQGQMDALSRIAANDTVIAADALGLQRQLSAAFASPAPLKLAAEPVGAAPPNAGAENTRTGPENR